jgi:divalent metal cation (Fe/Co/Zn/Cd) transporter
LHMEVDPQMTVQASHDLATRTRFLIRDQLDWVADVVVHVEVQTRGVGARSMIRRGQIL